jgi:hypothetical protein
MDYSEIIGQYCDKINTDNIKVRKLLKLYDETVSCIQEVVVTELNNDIAIDKISEILSVLEQELEVIDGTEL